MRRCGIFDGRTQSTHRVTATNVKAICAKNVKLQFPSTAKFLLKIGLQKSKNAYSQRKRYLPLNRALKKATASLAMAFNKPIFISSLF